MILAATSLVTFAAGKGIAVIGPVIEIRAVRIYINAGVIDAFLTAHAVRIVHTAHTDGVFAEQIAGAIPVIVDTLVVDATGLATGAIVIAATSQAGAFKADLSAFAGIAAGTAVQDV